MNESYDVDIVLSKLNTRQYTCLVAAVDGINSWSHS